MRRPAMLRVILAALLAAGPLSAYAAGGTPPLVVVNAKTVTKGAGVGSVTFLDPDTHKVLGSVDVGKNPTGARFSPDEKFLYVLNGGKRSAWSGAVSEEGTLTVIDVEARRVVSTIELGFDPLRIYFSPDASRLFCFSLGKRKKGEAAKAVVTVVDRATHGEAASIETAPGGLDAMLSSDGRWLYALHGDPLGKRKDARPALVVVDTASNTVAREVPLVHAPVEMVASPDGRYVYVLDRGKPSKDPLKNKDGRVFVLDGSSHEVLATHDAGADPGSLQLDERNGSVFVPSRASAKTKQGVLHGIRGAEVFAEVEVAEKPSSVRLGPDGSTLFVLCEEAISVVDLGQAKEIRRIPLALKTGEFLLSHDGRRGYVTERQGSDLALLDLADGKVAGVVKTGRGGVKFGKLMGAIALTALSYGAGYAGASGSGSPMFFYRVYTVAPATSQLALRKDGRFLYALNTLSNDVTIIDTETRQVVDKIATGGGANEIVVAPKGRHLYVRTPSQLTIVDTEKNTLAQKHDLGGGGAEPGDLAFSEGRRLAFVASSSGLQVVSLRTAARVASVVDLPTPRMVLVPSAFDALGEGHAAIEEHLDRAAAFEADAKLEDAAQEYRKVRALAPDDKALYFRLVELYLRTGKEQAAMEDLRQWVGEPPRDPQRCWDAAPLFLNRKLSKEAIPLLECVLPEAEEVGAPPAMLHYQLGRAYLDLRDLDAAARHAGEAKRLGEPRSDALLKEIKAAR